MSSKYHGNKQKDKIVDLQMVPLKIEVINPKKGSKHSCPCAMPMDCIGMDEATFIKSYGAHIVKATWDLLQHPAFKSNIIKNESPLIVAP